MEECDMKWIPDDSYLKKTQGKARKIEGGGDRPLPWWFSFDWLRPKIKLAFWKFAVMFGVSAARAETGYKLGFIVAGHAYVGDEALHHRAAIIYVNHQDWTIFAVDLFGAVIPDEGGTDRSMKEFWVDIHPDDVLDSYLDGRPIVD
jgi:hypothetical protein